MKQHIPPKYRYPLFFVGLMMMIITAIAYKFISIPETAIEAVVIIGFALFVSSFTF
jgi:hypothetical protein